MDNDNEELEVYRSWWEHVESVNDLHDHINSGTVPVELEEEFGALRVAWWAFEKKLYVGDDEE